MYLLAAISIGLLGSLHCMGMCGPILATVNQKGGGWSNDLLHHTGRLATYIVFGAVVGALGKSFDMMGFQQGFSVIIGVLLIVSVVLYPIARMFKQFESVLGRVSIKMSGWIHRSGLGRNQVRLLMGAANGLLPCGLVYLALAGAANTFTPWGGALFMMAFGAGTLPALLVIGRLSHQLSPSLRSRFRKLIPVTILIMGSLLFVRGLDLGVPYLSPKAPVESNEITDCH